MSEPPPSKSAFQKVVSDQQKPRRTWLEGVKSAGLTTLNHAKKHMGVGVVCAVAYFDPGNWGVDLQAGSQFGYRLLFVVLLAGLFAVYLQVLASRLGCVTGLDLASHTRLLLYDRPKHRLLYRWLGLYPLYLLAEIAIIATDLAELLGSAIALCMLFPKLQLWHGVLITAFDVIFILAMGDPLRGRPVRMFELLIAGMVLAMLICMIVIISKVDVHWGRAFQGYIPSKYIFKSSGLYTSVGILGATVMPHSLFLGSALATQDRISFQGEQESKYLILNPSKESEETLLAGKPSVSSRLGVFLQSVKASIMHAFRTPRPSISSTQATRHSGRENNSFEFVRAHLSHGVFDIVGSLLGFAVLINSLILILAAAVFFYGKGWSGNGDPASLFDAYDLIRDLVGQPAATLFAVALLAAGQSSSIIATVAGQAVSEGFLQWRVSPVIRRFLTRLLAIIPSMAVAIVVGRPGIDTLLVASQVVLSIVLPFITFPLIWCTSSKAIMTVRKGQTLHTDPNLPTSGTVTPLTGRASRTGSRPVSPSLSVVERRLRTPEGVESAEVEEWVDYSNNKIAVAIGVVIWLVVVAANVYVIVDLGRGGQV